MCEAKRQKQDLEDSDRDKHTAKLAAARRQRDRALMPMALSAK